jgi:predicted choloylglycine hydrolase
MQYYDAATFLLAGLMETVETEAGPTLRKLSFDDYRAFGGFKMPTLLALQNQSTDEASRDNALDLVAFRCNAIEFSSIEVNAVKESAVKMPADQRRKIAAAYKDPVYAEYERDLQALLPKVSKRVGKEVIKVEPLSQQFTVPRKLAIKGTPYELGLTIGYIGRQTGARLPMLSDKDLNRKVIELYQRIYPQQLEIIRGVAEIYETPADKIDAGVFEHEFTTSLWCGLLKYGRFYRATEFQKYTDFASNEHCSAASCYANGRQLVGRNFDNPSDKPHYFTTMELAGGYKAMGHTVYDITSWFVDGINERGLSLCVTTASGDREPYPNEPAVLMGHMCQIIMQTCASVEEALNLLRTVRVWFPDEVNHWLLADASGNAVVVEWNSKNHKLLVFERPRPYELLTNTPFELGEEAVLKNCWRYCTAKPMLEAGVQDAAGMFEVMKAVRVTSGPSRTLWTTVMDLNARKFEVRYFKEFDRKYEFKF